jgi:hypothetical protein
MMADIMSPKLLEVRERAKRDPRKQFMSLASRVAPDVIVLIRRMATENRFSGSRTDPEASS